jgi:glutathione S-transferase
MESRRPDAQPSAWWDERQKRKIDLGLDRIEAEIAAYTGQPTIAPIALGCTLHFMDRVLDDNWRAGRPGLARWYDSYRTEPHMAATEIND